RVGTARQGSAGPPHGASRSDTPRHRASDRGREGSGEGASRAVQDARRLQSRRAPPRPFGDRVAKLFRYVERPVARQRPSAIRTDRPVRIERRTNPMFIVLLNFSDNKGGAGQFMEGHKEWLKRGFDDGVFLLAGSLQPNRGGGIVAHNTSLPELQ